MISRFWCFFWGHRLGDGRNPPHYCGRCGRVIFWFGGRDGYPRVGGKEVEK